MTFQCIDIMTDLYADDATLYETSKSKEEIETKLQNALSDLAVWRKQNGMLINTDKTKAMLITTPQKRCRIDDNLQIFLNGVVIYRCKRQRVRGSN